MNMQRSAGMTLALALALALSGTAALAGAQTPPTSAQQDQTTPQGSSGQFYPGTESSATYNLQNGDGTLTVHAGMPDHVQNYGPPPPFKTLDTNHNGQISESEAQAYPPLESDFLFASGGRQTISRAQYEKWVKTQFK